MRKFAWLALLLMLAAPVQAQVPLGCIDGIGPTSVPDYFGCYPNYANSQFPTVNPTTGAVSGGLRKFVDTLPIPPTAVPDTTTYPGSDYYEIEVGQYTTQMHSDLPTATLVRGYRQTNMGGTPFSYLGPIIAATKDRPVRILFTNNLPIGTGGDLFIPTDTTYMGAGEGPLGPSAPNFTQNRVSTHLHGGTTPWISDGTPHQWITPAGESTPYKNGLSLGFVPDMWFDASGNPIDSCKLQTTCSVAGATNNPGQGKVTFFYSNQQSARLMFYHEHAYGITRLGVYAGLAAGYLLTDPVEQALIRGWPITYTPVGSTTPVTATFAAGTLPDQGIPLIIQDKTFVPDNTTSYTNSIGTWGSQLLAQDPTWDTAKWGGPGSLWFPHIYMPNQNPGDISGANPMGRWDYGPWFWPPFTNTTYTEIANPYYDPSCVSSATTYCEGPMIPGTPDARLISPSGTPESFMDTPVINGMAYPLLRVQPKLIRFRILNAANDRYFNLQFYVASAGIVSGFAITSPGSGYTSAPQVSLTGGGGAGATASAVVDLDTTSATYGQLTGIHIITVGNGYTAAPTVTITGGGGAGAAATANIYTRPTEVGMVPFNSTQDSIAPFPTWWYTRISNGFTFDDRAGGVPDPASRGPAMIQVGSEGGFLPTPALIRNQPVNYVYNRRDITVGNVAQKSLLLGPAERADILVDFTNFAGKTLILYNDSPAPVPAADPRFDYYTCDSDQTDTGGAPMTLPGYGPNTRTMMRILVGGSGGTAPVDDYNPTVLANLETAIPVAFAAGQDPIIVPQDSYNSVYNPPAPGYPSNAFVGIADTSMTFTPITQANPILMDLQPKSIIEDFQADYGRMNALLGVEMPHTNNTTQTSVFQSFIDPPTELVKYSTLATAIGDPAADGTQIWKITHNGVDTHAVHFHMFSVQLINRVGWDGAIRGPDANELGWKDTVRMNPLEDCIVALRPLQIKLPFKVPNSIRPLDPTRALGTTGQFTGVDPNNLPVTVTNELTNFGSEYVWHCHLLGHEENDMMRAVPHVMAPDAPTALSAAWQDASHLVLTWTDNSANETEFRIETATTVSGPWSTVATRTSTPVEGAEYGVPRSYTVATTQRNWYRVIASNTVGSPQYGLPPFAANPTLMTAESSPSNNSLAPVNSPTNLVATARRAGLSDQVTLTWSYGTTNGVSGFEIQQATNNTFSQNLQTYSVGSAVRSYRVTTARNLRLYYRIRALTPTGGSSGWTRATPFPITTP